MEINLTKDSIVDQRTGQVDTPSEYLENLRAIESQIQYADERLVAIKNDLALARKEREKFVAQLRTAVRDGRVLPLLELAEKDDTVDGLDTDPEDE